MMNCFVRFALIFLRVASVTDKPGNRLSHEPYPLQSNP